MNLRQSGSTTAGLHSSQRALARGTTAASGYQLTAVRLYVRKSEYHSRGVEARPLLLETDCLHGSQSATAERRNYICCRAEARPLQLDTDCLHGSQSATAERRNYIYCRAEARPLLLDTDWLRVSQSATAERRNCISAEPRHGRCNWILTDCTEARAPRPRGETISAAERRHDRCCLILTGSRKSERHGREAKLHLRQSRGTNTATTGY